MGPTWPCRSEPERCVGGRESLRLLITSRMQLRYLLTSVAAVACHSHQDPAALAASTKAAGAHAVRVFIEHYHNFCSIRFRLPVGFPLSGGVCFESGEGATYPLAKSSFQG